ncbi:hypothetical protein L1987_78240 [Smallanthus sonchifolius]|uniref:Uncharacterized protein n=1 Tax=Smallanthus sonchifolius TaxID=185202 RepID=A0ACB8ZCB3_9ASTR|nr:hypothetical protein L1987_78240 [Smallanthus sonchifolius]
MKPEDGEPLSLYMAVSGNSVNAILVMYHEGQQHPVNYVSKSLLAAETMYSHLEKLILALIMASTKLRHYFETHAIHVKTNYAIKCVLRKPEMSLAKRSVKLSAYDLIYEPIIAIKSQPLEDFVADFSSDIQHEADIEVQQLEESKDKWTLFTDGASNVRGTGLGIILKSPQGDIIPQSISCEFQAMNNETEYEAQIARLQLAWDMKIKYLQVPREDNTEAGALANLASALKIPEGPYLRRLEDPEALEVLKDIHEVIHEMRNGYSRKTSQATGGKVFMVAMTYYFSTWNEAEAFVQGIQMITSTPVHPQANGQAESSNKIIIHNLKKKLGAKKGRWAEELPFALWADRTTTKNATGQTPFSIVFGTEAMIPTEKVIPTARTNLQTPETNNEALAHDLYTVDELVTPQPTAESSGRDM